MPKRVAMDHKGQAIVMTIPNKSAELTNYYDLATDQIPYFVLTNLENGKNIRINTFIDA